MILANNSVQSAHIVAEEYSNCPVALQSRIEQHQVYLAEVKNDSGCNLDISDSNCGHKLPKFSLNGVGEGDYSQCDIACSSCLDDCEHTSDTHNEIYNSVPNQSPQTNSKVFEEEDNKVIESSISQDSENLASFQLRPQQDLLCESLYTITEEDSTIDFLAEEEEDSLVADEDSTSQDDCKLNSLKVNFTNLKQQKKHTFDTVKSKEL